MAPESVEVQQSQGEKAEGKDATAPEDGSCASEEEPPSFYMDVAKIVEDCVRIRSHFVHNSQLFFILQADEQGPAAEGGADVFFSFELIERVNPRLLVDYLLAHAAL